MQQNEPITVLTLDAGGTNFVFSAIRGGEEIATPITMPAHPDNLKKCLAAIVAGFSELTGAIGTTPDAISFAFPGPADYINGVMGDLPNLPAFRGGVALGPYLEKMFRLPVFINNDGNLFAYGEAYAGALPRVNEMLRKAGSSRVYKNLIGVTLGTGFGCGVVIDHSLLLGDNGCGGDLWNMRNKKYPEMIVEESVSIRAVKRVYQELSGLDASALSPGDIFEVAEGVRPGDRQAAMASFRELGEMAGDALIRALNIVDGLIVIGGGVSGASRYILPGMTSEMNQQLHTFAGDSFPGLQMEAFNLQDEKDKMRFLQEEALSVTLPFSTEQIPYAAHKKTAITLSALGTNKAVSIGAYAFALSKLKQLRQSAVYKRH